MNAVECCVETCGRWHLRERLRKSSTRQEHDMVLPSKATCWRHPIPQGRTGWELFLELMRPEVVGGNHRSRPGRICQRVCAYTFTTSPSASTYSCQLRIGGREWQRCACPKCVTRLCGGCICGISTTRLSSARQQPCFAQQLFPSSFHCLACG